MNGNYVAFDLGGSSGKVFLGCYHGGTLQLREIHRFPNQPVALGGGLYWDFLRIFEEMKIGLRKAAQCADGPIRSIGIDSFSNDFGIVSQRGELLTPVRCYRDLRTARCEARIYERFDPEWLYMRSGNQLALFGTFMQLASQVIEKTDQALHSGGKLLLLPDLLGYFLTGVARSEYTVSSVTQLYRMTEGRWDEMLIRQLGLKVELFADLILPGQTLGPILPRLEEELGLCGAEVVAVCGHDTASAFLAAADGEDTAVLSSGTWSLLGIERDRPILDRRGYQWNIANEGGYPGPHYRILANVMGNWILQELQRDLAAHGQALSMEDMLQIRPTGLVCRLNIDDPAFFSPGNMCAKLKDACGREGYPVPQTPAQMVECVYSSLAYRYLDRITQIETLTGTPIRQVRVVGGGSRNTLMNQMIANVCARPVLAGPAEATAFGNILAQMLASGEFESVQEGRRLVRSQFQDEAFFPKG